MKKTNCLYLIILFCLTVIYSGCSNTKSKDKALADPTQVDLTENILKYFQEEQFDKIFEHFDDNMKHT